MTGQALENGHNLLNGFSLTEDRLWKAASHLSVMIDPGKSQVFIWQVTQFIQGRIDVYRAVLDCLKKLF